VRVALGVPPGAVRVGNDLAGVAGLLPRTVPVAEGVNEVPGVRAGLTRPLDDVGAGEGAGGGTRVRVALGLSPGAVRVGNEVAAVAGLLPRNVPVVEGVTEVADVRAGLASPLDDVGGGEGAGGGTRVRVARGVPPRAVRGGDDVADGAGLLPRNVPVVAGVTEVAGVRAGLAGPLNVVRADEDGGGLAGVTGALEELLGADRVAEDVDDEGAEDLLGVVEGGVAGLNCDGDGRVLGGFDGAGEDGGLVVDDEGVEDLLDGDEGGEGLVVVGDRGFDICCKPDLPPLVDDRCGSRSVFARAAMASRSVLSRAVLASRSAFSRAALAASGLLWSRTRSLDAGSLGSYAAATRSRRPSLSAVSVIPRNTPWSNVLECPRFMRHLPQTTRESCRRVRLSSCAADQIDLRQPG
jgi:hypothetical protein